MSVQSGMLAWVCSRELNSLGLLALRAIIACPGCQFLRQPHPRLVQGEGHYETERAAAGDGGANPLFSGGENILDTGDHMGQKGGEGNPLWESKKDALRWGV